MWRELFESARHRGDRGAGGAKNWPAARAAIAGEKRTMTVPPNPAGGSGGDVSRETWKTADEFDTPIAAAAERAMQVLHTAAGQLPRPTSPPRLHGRQPEGRRRQDDDRSQPGRRTGRPGTEDTRHRPGPAGQREHRAGDQRPALRDPVVLRGAPGRDAPAGRHPAEPAQPTAVLRAGHHRPRRRGDRTRQHGGPGEPVAHRPGRRSTIRTSTSSSSTAHRPSGC